MVLGDRDFRRNKRRTRRGARSAECLAAATWDRKDMVEASEQRQTAAPASDKDQPWGEVRDAQASWAGAMRAHELAPPDPEFRNRLRALSEAARAMHDAHARA